MKKRAFLFCICVLSFSMCCNSVHAGKNTPSKPQEQKAKETLTQEEKDSSDTEKTDEKKVKNTQSEEPGMFFYLWNPNRNSRVTNSLKNYKKDEQFKAYLLSLNGRHELARELSLATAGVKAKDLTKNTLELITIKKILTGSRENGVQINLTDIQNTWAKIKVVKADVIKNLNDKIAEKRNLFMKEINDEFKKEALLIAILAEMQHLSAEMRKKLNDDPKNESDDEGEVRDHRGTIKRKTAKPWNQSQVFDKLKNINKPELGDDLGISITLQNSKTEVKKKRGQK